MLPITAVDMSIVNMSYTEILRKGFALNWNGDDCSKCEKSGGRCGSLDNSFICIYNDQAHSGKCKKKRSMVRLGYLETFLLTKVQYRILRKEVLAWEYQFSSMLTWRKPQTTLIPAEKLVMEVSGQYTKVNFKMAAVAVKRLYENNFKRVEQFMNEIEILTRLCHKNLVPLYGCTSQHCRQLLLV
ncbi:LEAF RUST 10 DISEASE-RESISTANCE LOCUS RECEPTOR-LIKE PROTEIN KINASE-like 1.2 isoform X2 [Apium graveolens]|uniref:LEAF RUST 10 DISEASE-RESISTANCE LOCUS RECEPTOR-LIKE PROTEIN KINASE-like 1.2 isoform X2 n=1 Tax=Apium graveolens TaxID=4045 RepID=UPI003D7B2282